MVHVKCFITDYFKIKIGFFHWSVALIASTLGKQYMISGLSWLCNSWGRRSFMCVIFRTFIFLYCLIWIERWHPLQRFLLITRGSIYFEKQSKVGSMVSHFISLLTIAALVVAYCSIVSGLNFIFKMEQLWLRPSHFNRE